jgi:hypothetical protein
MIPMAISAEVICDSISLDAIRLTTFKLRYPRFIHAEFMTHRRFSRNASSSRAVPTSKLIAEVRDPNLRAKPIWWGKNQSGMQAAEELDEAAQKKAKQLWSWAAEEAAEYAEGLMSLGAHKQLVNRILEPFTHINVVCSATEYDNFFGLRLDKGAQPEIRALAHEMWCARRDSTPRLLHPGEMHLPFVEGQYTTYDEHPIKISVARCARVSYLSFETGKPSTMDEDLVLYDKLVTAQPLHASPAEHQATPDRKRLDGSWNHPELHGNFSGWKQYRKTLIGEDIAPLPEEYLPF